VAVSTFSGWFLNTDSTLSQTPVNNKCAEGYYCSYPTNEEGNCGTCLPPVSNNQCPSGSYLLMGTNGRRPF
jgi:hypothetical protein